MRTLEEEENEVVKREFPEYNQVELICAVALEIVDNSHKLINPISGEAMKIKFGFHTGSIVAGIVGLSNIQFCLFGDAVNTASRMCSNSMVTRNIIEVDDLEIIFHFKFSLKSPIEYFSATRPTTTWRTPSSFAPSFARTFKSR